MALGEFVKYTTSLPGRKSDTNKWNAAPSMLHRRRIHAGVEYEGKLYCFGGLNDGYNVLKTVEFFCDGKWTAVADMPFGSSSHVAVVLPTTKCIALMGGSITVSSNLIQWRCIPRKMIGSKTTWGLPVMDSVFSVFSADIISDNQLLIFGTREHPDKEQVFIFHFSTQTWSSAQHMPAVE